MSLAVDKSTDAGPSVVCLPMFSATRAATAAAFAPTFTGTGLRQTYLDLPGHGDSPANCRPTSQAVMDTVCAWLDRHVDAPVLLAGASYGAYLAAGIARQRPDLVRGLLLVCPGVTIAPASRTLPELDPPDAPPGWLDDAPTDLRAHLDVALGHRTPAVVATVLAALRSGGPGDDKFQEELRTGTGYALPDEDADITFDGPVSVITGRQDGIVGYADQFHAMRHYPRGTFTTVDAAGHYLPFEQPTLLRSLTQDWLHRART
ncbi:pimeloyl-ACP methyl ester carboxylesterase [Micromonospora jinlongensis]|uniref:Pimeloyl-ACP methyl ester carboxylesterase n=1 Tax=Micromonospora jinlongensis TaxID=1287877 RepID=A0A7Y9WWZ6_9ACTN|nr:alpha/beta hydrolase [Micromonospora jinlongensis]NYH41086.1 pimeloyl-ACP methyl ester carboxylesterase [Micromonospora jinlongensis]